MEQVKQFIKSHGYDFEPEIDGQYHEFKTDDGKGWYIGEAQGDKVVFTFGDWKTSDRFHFKHGFSDEDKSSNKEQQEQFKRAKLERQKVVALECQKDFEALQSIGMSPYLSKKGIGSLLGCKTQSSSFGTADLVIPMYFEDKICNLQKIQEDGFKAFRPGGRTEGAYHVIGEVKDIVYITEGFATGASVHYATKSGVVVGFSASNLSKVAEVFRRKYPELPIVIAADDDHTKSPNAGKEAALSAASLVSGTFCFPDFGKGRADTQTDWNDLHKSHGLNEVAKQLKSHAASPPAEEFKLSDEEEVTGKKEQKEKQQTKSKARARLVVQEHLKPWINGVEPLPENWVDGKLQPPNEFQVASVLYNYYKEKMIRQDNDLFLYTGVYWRCLGVAEIDRLKIQIQVLYAGLAKSAQLNSAFNQFMAMLSSPPHNMFAPNTDRANFLNGTLHLLQDPLSKKWKTEFYAHNPLDFCINVIPIEYDKTRSIRNKTFEDMLHRIVGDGPGSEEKLRAIKQMYGACIFPRSAKIFLLWGKGGCGKSSVMIPAQKLVHEDNWSSVDPSEFKGFNMESMIGKLVNFVNDIDTTKPIDDANIKKFWDRMPIRIDRKFKAAIQAPLPAVHIFAGNDIPATYDKGTGAHERRWVMLNFKARNFKEDYILDYAANAFYENPQGVLNFALEGVDDNMLSGFKYFSPEESKETVSKWEIMNDRVALFLEAVKEGEVVGLKLDDAGRAKRGFVWEHFGEWHEIEHHKKPAIGRTKFFDVLEGKSLKVSKIGGTHYFNGLVSHKTDTSSQEKEGNKIIPPAARY